MPSGKCLARFLIRSSALRTRSGQTSGQASVCDTYAVTEEALKGNMKLNGAQIVWESLIREGVDVVFGFPGGKVVQLYHTLPDYPIRHVLVRHEQAARSCG